MRKQTKDEVADWLRNQPPLLTLAEAAKLLRVSIRQVDRYVAEKRLCKAKLGTGRGHRALIPLASVIDFVAEHLQGEGQGGSHGF